jgi:hypothetical protein
MIYAAAKAGRYLNDPAPIVVFDGSLSAAAKWVGTNPGAMMIIVNPDTWNPNGVKTTVSQLFHPTQLVGQICKAMSRYLDQLHIRAEVARTEQSRKEYAARVAHDAAASSGLV